jgi:hypothetical protein
MRAFKLFLCPISLEKDAKGDGGRKDGVRAGRDEE